MLAVIPRARLQKQGRTSGNAGGDNGCRSKLVANCRADEILRSWMPQWHRVTVFGEYRRLMKALFTTKGFSIVEEDK